MAIYSYSFSLTAPPAPAEATTHEYAFSEFGLVLDDRWRQLPADEDNARHFQSDADGAALVVSVDFVEVPDDQAQALADQCVDSRLAAIRAASESPVQVLQRGTRPHARGGLEMSFAAHAEGEHVHLYLGYVTARKVLNFSMICQPGQQAAIALFNATVPGFRPRLP